MDPTTGLSIAALGLALAACGWTYGRLRALGLGRGIRGGPLLERLGQVGRRLEALEAGLAARGEELAGLERALGRHALHPSVVHYAPLGLGGARNCFVLALLNGEGDGVLLNVLAGTGVRAELKQVRGWQRDPAGPGLAFTAEEEQALAANRAWWGVG